MFKTRLLSGILLVIIALITIISGGNILFGTVLVISLIGLSELYKVFKIEKKNIGNMWVFIYHRIVCFVIHEFLAIKR